jgi:putative SOS response-associated peptidase YedK
MAFYGEARTIITTTPNEIMSPIHNRMPVIVAKKDYGRWLDSSISGGEVADVLKPYPSEEMDAYTILSAVNSPKTDGPELIAPAEAKP